MARYTNEQKWTDDAWFIELDKGTKLMWIYLYETCEVAGIKELSLKQMKFLLDISEDELLISLWRMKTKIEFWSIDMKSIKNFKDFKDIIKESITDDPDFIILIYIKNFLKHQKVKELSTTNPFHKGIFLNIVKHIKSLQKESTLHECFQHIKNEDLVKHSLKLDNKKLLHFNCRLTYSSTDSSNSSSNSKRNSKTKTIDECAVHKETLKPENDIVQKKTEIRLLLEEYLSDIESERILTENKTLSKELIQKNVEEVINTHGNVGAKKGLFIHSLTQGYELVLKKDDNKTFKPNDIQKKYGNWILRLMNWVKKQELERITQENYQLLPPPEKEMFEENPTVEDTILYHNLKPATKRATYIYKANYDRIINTKIELFFEKKK